MEGPTLEDRLQRIASGDLQYSNMEHALDEAGSNADVFERVHTTIQTGLEKRIAEIRKVLAAEETRESMQEIEFWADHLERFSVALSCAKEGHDATLVDSNALVGIVIPGSPEANTQERRYSYLNRA